MRLGLASCPSARDFATRRANLNGTGTGVRANDGYFLRSTDLKDAGGNLLVARTVFDDGSADVLTGSSAEELVLPRRR